MTDALSWWYYLLHTITSFSWDLILTRPNTSSVTSKDKSKKNKCPRKTINDQIINYLQALLAGNDTFY